MILLEIYNKIDLINKIRSALSDELRNKKYQESDNKMKGHCYVASEVFYHLMGGSNSGYIPQVIKIDGDTHWFLKNKKTGEIVDITHDQFKHKIPYNLAKGIGFLTKEPSKRAQEVINRISKL